MENDDIKRIWPIVSEYLLAQLTQGEAGLTEGRFAKMLGVDRLEARETLSKFMDMLVDDVPVPFALWHERQALVAQVKELTAERDALRVVLAELYNNSLSDQETRILMTIAGGSTMANPGNPTGQANHARCDRIEQAREAALAALATDPDTTDPYDAFGRWAAAHGYDLDTADGRAAAIAEYGKATYTAVEVQP